MDKPDKSAPGRPGSHAVGSRSEGDKSGASARPASGGSSGGSAGGRSGGPPSVALPKGGGAIKGIGEKFTANPVTGTGSWRVPVPLSPGRSGFGPELALAYDSGSGNGPFGMGWSIGLPGVTRKTDKGLPRYIDREESDVFILSGAEDLVPVLKYFNGQWVAEDHDEVVVVLDPETGEPVLDPITHEPVTDTYTVRHYRPRVEGLFARIEKWKKTAGGGDVPLGDTHWRSISKDNITTIYGDSLDTRIADPAYPTWRVFSWLISRTMDDKGNVVVYEYKREDGANRPRMACEHNRTDVMRATGRYIKRIKYGNVTPYSATGDWLFEVVFDYGEHDAEAPTPNEIAGWSCRKDPFSTYRPCFEVRTYRLCRRILMFHHVPGSALPGDGGYDGLVRSLELAYRGDAATGEPVASFLASITQRGYRLDGATYTKASMPPLTFEYGAATIDPKIRFLDAGSLEGLPAGLGRGVQWVDLDGEGASGLLTEQGGAWYYKRNTGASHLVTEGGAVRPVARFGAPVRIEARPGTALAGGARFVDLAGDGQVDLAVLDGPGAGFFERTDEGGWAPFRTFAHRLNLDFGDPNLRLVDLTGDGRADVLITQNEVLTWYPSEGETGFGKSGYSRKPWDEEKGPKVVFADALQSVHLADMSGDGLSDIVRIRHGEVCYWPNLGYGRFGAKVTMDLHGWFDRRESFDSKRVILADIDGSGTTDLLYLRPDGVRVYRNESGNRLADPEILSGLPVENVSSVAAMDLLGTGTACLVWSSPLPSYARSPMRYIDLMGGIKPHLLTSTKNGLGAETVVTYAPSTRFYQEDRAAGRPWITRLPFLVHVVERVETLDKVSGNRFITRYAYHHGYFDGEEREFRGFGMVEQWDTEEYSALSASGGLSAGTNVEEASHVPPVLTRTWFHTGFFAGAERISRLYQDEYYGHGATGFEEKLLPDTVLPDGLTAQETREACRALKGSPLRKEVYAEDGSDKAAHPYTVSELNYTLKRLQPRGDQRHAVFFAHPREVVDYHHERNPDDPRVQHALTLAVDDYGNVLRAAAVGYGRGSGEPEQTKTLVTWTASDFTDPVDEDDSWRAPLPCESIAYEVTGLAPSGDRFALGDFEDVESATAIGYEETPTTGVQNRPLAHTRTLYRKNDLSAALALGTAESRAIPYETYTKVFTPDHLTAVYGSGRVTTAMMEDGGYVHQGEEDDDWWAPSGRVFFSVDAEDTAAEELAIAEDHFFLPRRFEDPFGNATTITYDGYDLLVRETQDAAGNQVTAGERGENFIEGNDYRVLAPRLVMDPNGNRAAVAFDALGRVVGTAVMGKPSESLGDTLDDFAADLTDETVADHLADPLADPHAILGGATTRFVYDPFAYDRTKDDPQPQPAAVLSLAREAHYYPTEDAEAPPVRVALSYSDGFGREIQQKVQAEPGPVEGVTGDVDPRWVGSGWTVFNNKGKPVRQYEPFFSDTHEFEFAKTVGVSPILFYDPLDRVVGTLHPDHSWEKVVFDAWDQVTWDRNDTTGIDDPTADADVGDYFARLGLDDETWDTWHERFSDVSATDAQQDAAAKALAHADTPTTVRLDALARPFLTIQHNGFDEATPPAPILYETRVALDIEGNEISVTDALDRVVMTYAYDRRKTRVRQDSVDAGTRWTLPDVGGNPVRAWDERDHVWTKTYDVLRRPVETWVATGTEDAILAEEVRYGESETAPETDNLRGQVVRVRDAAGEVVSSAYDFKGNLLSSTRQLAVEYQELLDWNGSVALESETFETATTYDALNRVATRETPDGSVTRPAYNEAGLLETIEVQVRGEVDESDDPVFTAVVTNIDYDAHGRRVKVEHGNGVETTYAYDAETFRLTNLVTTRTSDSKVLQDLTYTYDPLGNVTRIADAVQKDTFFDNDVVSADRDYAYDPLYRLISASGREHPGQQPPPGDPDFCAIPHPHDTAALRAYTETYAYDAVGNFDEVVHSATGGNWTREYAYVAGTNRLATTTVGSNTETYSHDAHGNMTVMPHLAVMAWDAFDRLRATSPATSNQPVTYYVYDAAGQRVRKVTETGGESSYRSKERVYLGDFERYREYDNLGATQKERETLHVMDDKQRVALVETLTVDDGDEVESPTPRIRYQHSDHLGSSCVETDDEGDLLTYEEYFPYGGTSFHSASSASSALGPKRYRYTGKELDDENGFTYHGARYYAPWLGRWTAADPAGLVDGVNLFIYVLNNPLIMLDRNGRWGEKVHVGITYLIGRWMGEKHEEALKFALANQRVDDDPRTKPIKTIGIGLSLFYVPGMSKTASAHLTLGRGAHGFGQTPEQAGKLFEWGISHYNPTAAAMGLHAKQDMYSHFNVDTPSWGHRHGVTKGGTLSSPSNFVADDTVVNPDLALAAVDETISAWSEELGISQSLTKEQYDIIVRILCATNEEEVDAAFKAARIEGTDSMLAYMHSKALRNEEWAKTGSSDEVRGAWDAALRIWTEHPELGKKFDLDIYFTPELRPDIDLNCQPAQ